MAKKRRKPRRRPQIPALSRTDKVIYHVLMILSPVLGFGLLYLATRWQSAIAAEGGTVAAVTNPLGGMLLFLFAFFHAGIFLQLKQDKVHLFGRRDITYGPPQWREAYPIFRKHPKVERKPDELWSLRWRWGAYLTAWAVVLAVFFLTLCPRDAWNADGSVTVWGSFDQVKKEYTVEEIDQVCFETDFFRTGGRRSSRYEAGVQVYVTTADGEVFRFDYSDFNYLSGEADDGLSAMVKLKDIFDPGIIEYRIDPENDLEDVISDRNYNEEMIELLHLLFNE